MFYWEFEQVQVAKFSSSANAEVFRICNKLKQDMKKWIIFAKKQFLRQRK